MQDDEGDCDKRYPAVKVIDDVFAPWLGDVSEAGSEAELETHHRQARVADRDDELPQKSRGVGANDPVSSANNGARMKSR
jgi:hypothetical protein